MAVTPLSQRNSQWASQRLGWGSTNTSTIGSHGCTITSLAMLAGLTPADVNARLIANKGYAAHKNTPNTFNLILWTVIKQAIPWLEFEWRNYTYSGDDDNKRVADAIKKNGACLVAVDGTKIGGSPKDGHWVLYIGNQQMIDPWDGQVKPTSHYPATGFAIINKVGTPPSNGGGNNMSNMYKGYDLNNPDSMKIAVDHLVAILNKEYIKSDEAARQLENAIKTLKDQHSAEITRVKEAAEKEKQAEIASTLAAREEFIRGSLANALQVGAGEQLDDLIYMVKELKDQQNNGNGGSSSKLEEVLANEGYEIASYTIKKK